FALIVVDLDGFKDVNDVRGHGAGDAVLRCLSRRFESIVRASDTVARVGGDEFVVLSLGTGDDEQAAALVGRMRHALRRPFRFEGSLIEIDGSVGWAIYPADGATASDLLTRADGKMYATKRDTSDDARLARRGIGDLLDGSPVDAGRLTLEIVPAGPGAGSALDDEVLARLRELGVRISLDDGGRAASFAALRTLPLDELKIDTGFVHGLGRSATD